MPNLTKKPHPPVDVEYQWVSVQEEDLNLGVKVMFVTTIFMVVGLVWAILMTYDGDSTRKHGCGAVCPIFVIVISSQFQYPD